ncbi:MAG: protein kinase [Alphaproteobacteria bacterium]|nr:protein kinase [Alphaproteobacteria bacterium]MCB9697793.1 protein kinase [Alphaproteobacteria bacterium]
MEIAGYRLEQPIGRGGSGEVWDAVHLGTGQHVAIKVLVGASGDDPQVVDFVRHEVRAVAALDHPNVVAILDHGLTDDGRPWLVMERVDGPSLSRGGVSGWRQLRAVLLAVLDALAHAHARGVVHRDVKPGNVLIDRGGAVKLVDFGLARLQAEGSTFAGQSGGTPSYTAPEQIAGELGLQGPWTDLYSVGCVAWRMSVGWGPFRVRNLVEALHAHLHEDLPPYEPRFDVPDGFEAWVRRLLERDPRRRTQRAADAAWQLRHLPDVQRPPIPPDFRRRGRRLRMLPGAGLGLYGMRAVPIVGREAQQERLWRLLREVADDERPRAIVLHGEPGVGKTRLAEWLGRRAHEVGAAEVLVARHDPGLGEGSGVVAALARLLGCFGVGPEDVERTVNGWAAVRDRDAELAGPLVDLLCGRTMALGERLGVIRATLVALARERPLVVHLDDAHVDPDAGALVEGVLRAGHGRILTVLTTTEEARLPASLDRLEVGPLEPEGRQALVRELLGLRGDLALEVEERTAGNPLFAVQLVGDWVARQILVADRRGFRLAEGAEAHVPGTLREVGAEAVARVVSGAHEPALQVAALLGMDVATSEWRAACQRLGVVPSEEAVDALIDARLARRTRDPDGLAFAHGLVRDALIARCEAQGRARDAHRACAAAVVDPTRRGLHLVAAGEDEAALEPLLDSLQRAAGEEDYRRAHRPLTVRDEALARLGVPASDPRWGDGRLHRARVYRLQGDWLSAEDACRSLVADADGYGWKVAGRARIELATVLRARGRVEEALSVLDDARAATVDDVWLRGTWYMRHALLCYDRRRLDEARHSGHQALAVFGHLGLPAMAAHVHVALSMVESLSEHPARVEQHLVAARDAYVRSGSRAGVANTWNNLGELRRTRGDREGAAEAYRRALQLYEAVGSGHAVLPRTNLGVLELESGRPAEAAAILAEGAAELERQGRVPLLAIVEVGRMTCCALLGDGPGFDALAARVAGLLEQSAVVDADAAVWARQSALAWGSDPERAKVALRVARRMERSVS